MKNYFDAKEDLGIFIISLVGMIYAISTADTSSVWFKIGMVSLGMVEAVTGFNVIKSTVEYIKRRKEIKLNSVNIDSESKEKVLEPELNIEKTNVKTIDYENKKTETNTINCEMTPEKQKEKVKQLILK